MPTPIAVQQEIDRVRQVLERLRADSRPVAMRLAMQDLFNLTCMVNDRVNQLEARTQSQPQPQQPVGDTDG